MKRQLELTAWLHSLFPAASFDLAPASADASFRRYFRVTFSGSELPATGVLTGKSNTLIAMDAPPQHEDCRPFVHVASLFGAAGVNVPQVLEQNLEQGFLLLSDLGNTTYLQALCANPAGTEASELNLAAIDALLAIQLASRGKELPPYDEALLTREMRLFPEWYAARFKHAALNEKQSTMLENMFRIILRNNLAQPRTYVHRDYHSRNLMVTEPNPGILDFQDAVYGPITYDLVSYFKDAYFRRDDAEVLDWLARYWEKARKAGLPVHADFGDFFRDFEWMGVQRHLKVLGIFARLYYRDGKAGYLKDLPLVMEYLRSACRRYDDLTPLLHLLDELEKKQPVAGIPT